MPKKSSPVPHGSSRAPARGTARRRCRRVRLTWIAPISAARREPHAFLRALLLSTTAWYLDPSQGRRRLAPRRPLPPTSPPPLLPPSTSLSSTPPSLLVRHPSLHVISPYIRAPQMCPALRPCPPASSPPCLIPPRPAPLPPSAFFPTTPLPLHAPRRAEETTVSTPLSPFAGSRFHLIPTRYGLTLFYPSDPPPPIAVATVHAPCCQRTK